MFEKLMFAMMFETQGKVFNGIHKLIQKYKANNVDVIPISEIEKVFQGAISTSIGKDSLVGKMLVEEKGE